MAINEKVRLFQQLGQVILDPQVSDDQVRPDIFKLIPQAELQQAIENCKRLIRPSQDESYDFFAARYSYIRQFAPTFLSTFTFHSTLEADPLLKAVAIVRQLNEQGKRTVPQDAPLDFVSPGWQPFVGEPTPQIQRRYYELCVLWELRRGLRAGNIWLEDSRRYTNPQTYLIPKIQWNQIRTDVCQMLGMPEEGEQRLKTLATQLDHELLQFSQTVVANDGIRIENEQLVVSPLEAEVPSETVKALQSLVSKCLPLIDLTDLIIEVDHLAQFSQRLVHTSGNRSRSDETQVYLYASLLSQACNLGTAAMSQVSELSHDRLLWHTHWYLDVNTLPPANTALVDYHHRLPLSQIWGGGTLSSSDGQRFPVAVKNTQATALPRYFGAWQGHHVLHLDFRSVFSVRQQGDPIDNPRCNLPARWHSR